MKVYFDDLEAGWVNFKIVKDGVSLVEDSFSYTPYDSFGELIGAIHLLKSASNFERTVVFHAEPMEYELVFTKEEDEIGLAVKLHESYKRTDKFESVFSLKGSYDQICMPFWRALRRLQTEHTPEELNERWHRAFPTDDLNKLNQLIKGKKV